MKPKLDIKRYAKRLKQLQLALAAAGRVGCRRGTCESIHRLRVILRRVRLYLRLGRFLFKGDDVKNFNRWSKHTSDVLGPVRDRDMALAWLREHPVAQGLTLRVQAQRRQSWEAARKRLKDMPAFPTVKNWKHGDQSKAGKKLSKRLSRSIQMAREVVIVYKEPFDPHHSEGWHKLRRVVRRWRYLHELQRSKQELKTDAILSAQLALQEQLGEAQNLNAVWLMVRAAAPEASAGEIKVLLEQERQDWLIKAQAALTALQRQTQID
ncbi:MAG: CHAD domain-containing protein [Verrucomicrobiota bacterium]